MRVTIKTREQLLADGWQEGVYKTHYGYREGLWRGPHKQPSEKLSAYECKLLGKEVIIIEAELKGECPRFHVQHQDYTTWLPWSVFTEELGMRTPKLTPRQQVTKQIGKGKATHYLSGFFEFDCAYSNLTNAEAIQLCQWVAQRCGYRLVKRRGAK